MDNVEAILGHLNDCRSERYVGQVLFHALCSHVGAVPIVWWGDLRGAASGEAATLVWDLHGRFNLIIVWETVRCRDSHIACGRDVHAFSSSWGAVSHGSECIARGGDLFSHLVHLLEVAAASLTLC